jgi:hypothetical protein
MKKTILLTALLSVGSLCFAGRDIPLNFEKNLAAAAANAVAPKNWHKNFATVKNIGVSKIDATAKGEKFLNVKTTTQETPFYTPASYKVKPGEILEVEVEASGKGTLLVGFYSYNKKGGWYSTPNSIKKFALTPNKKEYKAEFKLANVGANELAAVRIVFGAGNRTDVNVYDVEAEIENPKK